MHRQFHTALALAFVSSAAAQNVEDFDRLSPQPVRFGQPVVLDRFRIEIPAGGRDAALRAAPVIDGLASGVVLGTEEGQPSGTVFLYFDEPWKRVDLSIVLPPTHAMPAPETAVLVYGDGDDHAWTIGLRHSEAGLRQRVGLASPQGRPIRKLMILLRDGAYIDNVEWR